MTKMTEQKKQAMLRLSNESGVIAALAIDQRGALKKMISAHKPQGAEDKDIIDFKTLVSKELTPYASAILLDPEYGLPAAKTRSSNAGLLLAYEKTGYDATKKGRLPDLLNVWSAKRLKEAGADAAKFLLYYDIDESADINDKKHAFIERLGSECAAEDIPFYLELVSYDANNADTGGKEYAKVKPHKVNAMMKEFSKPRYAVDVLKVEVPVNMKYVEGYASGNDYVYTREQAAQYFREQSEASPLPFIFLSAGVSAELFQETLRFAKTAGSTFNGVLCGRATWANGVEPFIKEGEDAAKNWLQTQGKRNINDLNEVLKDTASSWFDKI
ncbi:tagatose-bisphosphate aldolase [Brenneria populi]|uniref:Tagatose-bisphosphate aldolase n=1 Tax=Brenneria populi TaxID=1505588 RepID=A0ABU6JL98_9GAMM|nr:tagatose-bisphosphate aldolase [Brenneria populi Li et al. 2015]